MEKAIFLFCLLSACVYLAIGETVTIGNVNYFISPTKANWYEANRICKADHGMVLIDILDERENNRINEVIAPLKGSTDTGFWTSGTDLGSEGSFYWASSGHSMLYSNWDSIQPDNYQNIENCVLIDKEYGYKWNDENCNTERYFICRKSVSYPLNNCICLNT